MSALNIQKLAWRFSGVSLLALSLGVISMFGFQKVSSIFGLLGFIAAGCCLILSAVLLMRKEPSINGVDLLFISIILGYVNLSIYYVSPELMH